MFRPGTIPRSGPARPASTGGPWSAHHGHVAIGSASVLYVWSAAPVACVILPWPSGQCRIILCYDAPPAICAYHGSGAGSAIGNDPCSWIALATRSGLLSSSIIEFQAHDHHRAPADAHLLPTG